MPVGAEGGRKMNFDGQVAVEILAGSQADRPTRRGSREGVLAIQAAAGRGHR